MSRIIWLILWSAVVIGMQSSFNPLHAAGAQLFPKALTPLLNGAAGKPIGSLAPGAALTVLGTSGTATHVTFKGWLANGYVYAAPDKRIILMRKFIGHGSGATQTVEGTAYQAVTVDGWVATGALVDNMEPIWNSASALVGQKCASCHALPVASSLTANQWIAMMKTQTSNAGLDDDEAALITAYMQAHAKK